MIIEQQSSCAVFAWLPIIIEGKFIWLKKYGVTKVWFPKSGNNKKWSWVQLYRSEFLIV